MIVVLPMAGRGSRFQDSEPSRPKPLIEVAGKPMFAWALESLRDVNYSQIVFVALREHEEHFGVTETILKWSEVLPDVILLDEVTEGQLCTVLTARDLINVDDDVLVTCSDTYIESTIGADIEAARGKFDGLISVADLPGDRWSFAKTDNDGRVIEVAEKRRISNNASTGLYYFSNGKTFVETSEGMIANRELTNGEFFVIPVYQKYIERQQRIGLSNASRVLDMGTPESLACVRELLPVDQE